MTDQKDQTSKKEPKEEPRQAPVEQGARIKPENPDAKPEKLNPGHPV